MSSTAGKQKPNVILIMCDQMRYDCAGFASPDRFGFAAAARTPTLDRLARQGVVFDNAYCGSPQCSPARACWLTGLLSHATGQMLNYGPANAGKPGYELHQTCTTIADRLHDVGYRCGLAGPWHLGGDENPQHGFDAMWKPIKYVSPEKDAYQQYLTQNGLLDAHREAMAYGKQLPADAAPVGCYDLPAEHQLTSWTVQQTIDFCRASTQAAEPFFAFCSIKDPHPPILPPREMVELFDELQMPLPDTWNSDLAGKPDWLRNDKRRVAQRYGEAGCRRYVAYFNALVAHMDRQIGLLLDSLDELNIADNTIVCFISDHGEMLFEHGMFAKATMLETSVRVPWVMRWPSRIKSNHRITTPVSGLDLMPTLLDLIGLPAQPNIDGRSLAAAIQAGDEPTSEPVVAEIATLARINNQTDEDAHLAGSVMLRDGDWKLVCHHFEDHAELYNLAADPDEHHNLATATNQQTRLAAMSKTLRERLTRTGPGAYQWVIDRTQ